jgi:xanthosine utilization system XapX-like protein
MRHQRGVSLSGLLVWGAVIAAVALLGIRVAPEVMDYYKIKKIVASTAANSSGKTVPEIRAIFGKYADVDHIETITAADLDISKEGNQVVIAFEYEKRIPLFLNVSLLIDFQGSSSER